MCSPPCSRLRAHVGDRVYPVYQLTEEMAERIDVGDGSVDEWMELEPSLTLESHNDSTINPGSSDGRARTSFGRDYRMQQPIWLKLALSLAGFLSVADAQPPDRVYPVVELTDRDVAEIDVTDGSVEDWENIAGEPTLTPLDFAQTFVGSYDPSDMDFRIWLGWHEATDRLFFAMERVDDVYVNHFEREDDELLRIVIHHDSSVEFAVDGDHSGGAQVSEESSEDWLQDIRQAQVFHALGEVFDGGSQLGIFPHSIHMGAAWFSQPPFAHGGGAVFGGSPIIFSVTEFYVTPFDRFVSTGPEDSDVSDLFGGKIIGFNISIPDVDVEVDGRPGAWETLHLLAASPLNEYRPLLLWSADDFADGVLVTPDGLSSGDSAVESDSWARIKAAIE